MCWEHGVSTEAVLIRDSGSASYLHIEHLFAGFWVVVLRGSTRTSHGNIVWFLFMCAFVWLSLRCGAHIVHSADFENLEFGQGCSMWRRLFLSGHMTAMVSLYCSSGGLTSRLRSPTVHSPRRCATSATPVFFENSERCSWFRVSGTCEGSRRVCILPLFCVES